MSVFSKFPCRLPATPRRSALALALCIACVEGALPSRASGMPPPDQIQLDTQWQEYQRVERKNVVQIQPFRAEQQAEDPEFGSIRLLSLNRGIRGWYLLETDGAGGGRDTWHIENAYPALQTLEISDTGRPALLITWGEERFLCRPWEGELADAARADLPFAPICGGRLYLRNPARGARSTKESVAEFLRDNVWFGEDIVRAVRETVYKDAFLESSETVEGEATARTVVPVLPDARVGREARMAAFVGFDLAGEASTRDMVIGRWYPVADTAGIYASAFQPGEVNPDILNRRGETNALDSVERRANVYLLAFDMSQFDIGYEPGTDHPRLGWSPRPPRRGAAGQLPGPDGFDRAAPLVRTGMVTPVQAGRIAAVFTGGYKREHGAFRFGDYAQSNNGHHYGFIVHGTVLSKPQPDLATLYVLDDGTIGMKSWQPEDEAMLPRIRFARQNGLPLIERHPATGEPVPGSMVRHWGPGNWSGSAKAELRTLRSGTCLKWHMGRPFLIYAYFSSVTPSAMARTFQAYGCDYAMQLDMNALEHTYSALYTPAEDGPGLDPRHLVEGMALVDERDAGGERLPRFVAYPDNRDFFYLLRKEPGP